MNKDELKLMQNYPLWMKVEKTKLRIQEWYEYWDGQVYVSYSGGKDSTVLLHIVRQLYPDVPAVFCNTGTEYPELQSVVRKQENLVILRPNMPFKQILEERGYPVVSKDVSDCVKRARKNIAEGKTDTVRVRQIRGLCEGSRFNKGKWEFLLDAPFKISADCCDELKKKPFKKYEKETNRKPMIATMATESQTREAVYLKTGCNAFDSKRPKSTPLGFWTEQDVLQYIYENELEIPSVYGDIIKDENGLFMTTGVKRTGCMYCPFGAHLEKYPNRFQQMQHTHPKHYKYMLEKLGFKQVFDYIGIEYKDKQRKLF
ncbi:MAG: phosphoadenosine phosphosulfate reductase family protein [Terrisporobacter sp.]|uniref:phosphoadenosine phosphosulfate reductase domain-containing protein n=1 Tax=Terrisporobacter sp. TaxID=1965305 RepID=UPI002A91F8D3|nr:phosphoadenosine phosphosulfate reductase family protein [Terrisporobacter sp.]MDY6152774.1 phosphoadenosine phosphosulfate reductase family protein [Terrisporobacter sp.]